MIAWAIIEPLLLRLCGPERNGNLFCLPFSETYDMASSIIPQWLSAIEHYSGGRYWNKRGKYACLNTDPLHTFGSVEARCFPATTDAKKLTEWVSWVTNVKSWVRESKDETYEELIDASYRDPESTIRKIFGDYPVGSHTYPNTPSELIRSGVETAYEIWKAFQPVFNYKEPIKKGKKFATAELNDFWSDDPPTAAFNSVPMPPVPNPELYFTEDDD
jgi:Putative amidoligase enzyme.